MSQVIEQASCGNPNGGAFFAGENKSGSAAVAGQPVAVHPSGIGFTFASQTDLTSRAVGLLAMDTATGVAGDIQTDLTIELSDWSGSSGATLLVAGSTYYLGSTPGTITNIAPTGAGSRVQKIGDAITSTRLRIAIGQSALLS